MPKKKESKPESEPKKKCFVIMPMSVPKELLENKIYDDGEHFRRVYEHVIEPAIKACGWEPEYPETKGSEVIIANIIDQLLEAEMVVCDISILNPNVFYEAGIRTALDLPMAFIKDDKVDKIPFDTSSIKTQTYRSSMRKDLAEDDIGKLKNHFQATFDKSDGINLVWKKYGTKRKAEEPTVNSSADSAKLDILIDKIQKLESRNIKTGSSSRSLNKKAYELRHQMIIQQLEEFCSENNIDLCSMDHMNGEYIIGIGKESYLDVTPSITKSLKDIEDIFDIDVKFRLE